MTGRLGVEKNMWEKLSRPTGLTRAFVEGVDIGG